jgi:hypothetical protein
MNSLLAERNDTDKIINYFKSYINSNNFDSQTLNKIFYYSLFDYISLFDGAKKDATTASLCPISEQRTNIGELRTLLKRVFPKRNKFLKEYNDFEWNYVSSDRLSRIIILAQLSSCGIHLDTKLTDVDGRFDLEMAANNVSIELKRVWGWTNYWNYLKTFCIKARTLIDENENNKLLFVVTSAYPLAIDEMFKKRKDIELLNLYINKVIKSHFAGEHLLNRYLNTKNISFIIEHIDKQGFNDCHLQSLCGEIGSKLETLGDNGV